MPTVPTTALHAPHHPHPVDRLLRQLHPLHAPAARRRRLRPRRSRPRDAAPPRLRHALRQRHPLPRKGPAALLVDGRLHEGLPTPRRHVPRRPRRSRAAATRLHHPRARLARRGLRAPGLPQRPRRTLRRAHHPLQLRHLHLHPHHHPRRGRLPLDHARPLRLLAYRRIPCPPNCCHLNRTASNHRHLDRTPPNVVISTEAKRSGEIAALAPSSQRHLRYSAPSSPPPAPSTSSPRASSV